MADSPDGGMVVRRAEPEDLDEMIGVINRAFTRPGDPMQDFLAMYPYLFHEKRIREHFIAVDDGRIAGATGVYGFDVKIDGVMLRGGAVGQVSALPECRGRGVMTSILKLVIREMERKAYDFSWLGGDRRRYGFFGWAVGGVIMRYGFTRKYLPDPPAASRVKPLSQDEMVETIKAHRETLLNTTVLSDFELPLLIQAKKCAGKRLDDSWLIHNEPGSLVWFGGGQAEGIALLLAHLIDVAPAKDGREPQLTVECANEPMALSRACMNHYRHVNVGPSCMWRVGKLVPFLEKACEMARPRVSGGSDALALVNTDTGESATIECASGKLSARDGAGDDALRFNTKELSEICFGPCPLENLLPDLAPDSPLRRILPVRAHHTWFYSF